MVGGGGGGGVLLSVLWDLRVHSLQLTNTENSEQTFPGKELSGLSINFHINVSVSDYLQDRSTCFLQQNRQINCGKSLTDK